MTIDDPTPAAMMRISDAERDHAASILGNAMADGRLTAEEHSDRIDAVYASKTHADLVPLVSDLPDGRAALGQPSADLAVQAAAGSVATSGPTEQPAKMTNIFGGTEKKGRWLVPSRIHSVNVFGGAELDLCDAVLPGKEIHIRTVCVFGGMEIVVPPEMIIEDSGFSVMGGRSVAVNDDVSPDAPVLHIHAICVFGGVDVSRRKRKHDKQRKAIDG
ncbi:MAG TPA: DUF1707 domain-containing protein [Streptosporangiaceae bacterium]|nr:DUF1707 domain-containing protein [Streptosporangiaceae bacterium]